MLDYRKVVEFSFKNKTYNMYLDNRNKHFFLNVSDDGKLSYITLEEMFELNELFSTIPMVMNIKKGRLNEKINLIPKIIIGGVAVPLTLLVLTTCTEMYNSNKRLEEIAMKSTHSQVLGEEDLGKFLSYGVDSDKDFVVDTYLESDKLNYLFVYDMKYLDKVLEYKNVSLAQLEEVVNNNPLITDKFKTLLFEYFSALVKKYPNIDLRVLYENLKTLEIVECDRSELVKKTLSVDSYGCYVKTENKIYVLKDNEYLKGTWAYQVIFHEFSHVLRTGDWNINGKDVKVQVEGQNFDNLITSEALNSLFAVSLFDFEEKDIAYQLQSNYHSVILECLDNYSLSDYVNHSLGYYPKKIDEYNGDENYATVILELIQVQYDDYHSSNLKVKPEVYHLIYDYIAEMYYNKYINENMDYNQARIVVDKLVNKIIYDVPKDYNIDVEHFYEYFDEYYNAKYLNSSSKMR